MYIFFTPSICNYILKELKILTLMRLFILMTLMFIQSNFNITAGGVHNLIRVIIQEIRKTFNRYPKHCLKLTDKSPMYMGKRFLITGFGKNGYIHRLNYLT